MALLTRKRGPVKKEAGEREIVRCATCGEDLANLPSPWTDPGITRAAYLVKLQTQHDALVHPGDVPAPAPVDWKEPAPQGWDVAAPAAEL